MAQENLLQIRSLNVTFRQGEHTVKAVHDVSFDVPAGQTVALVGESGSGKSVTANAILRLLPAKVTDTSGEILFANQNLCAATPDYIRSLRGASIAMVFQEPMTALNPLHTVEKQIGEILDLHKRLLPAQKRARIIELLKMVEIPDPESRLGSYPHQLSGGQRQRVMIAMAFACEPALLIADEPTTALDVTVQKQILELIRRLQREKGMSVLLITHDLGIVEHFSDHVVVMNKGTVVERADTKTLFRSPTHPYTRQLLASEPAGSPKPVVDDAATIVDIKSLKVWFPIRRGFFKRTVGHVKAVDDITLHLRRGETLGIVGESGSGKSTLAQALLRLVESEGHISLHNVPIQNLGPKHFRPYRRMLQIVFQDPFASMSPRMSVAEIVAEGLRIHCKLDETDIDSRVCNALTEVGLDPQARFRFPHEFSGGQRQRIAIARALILNPELIVLDEPTSALDRSIQAQVIALLRDLQKKHNISYIFISHDLKVVRAMSHRIVVMNGGKIVESGAAESVFNAPTHPYTRSLLEAAFLVPASETADQALPSTVNG